MERNHSTASGRAGSKCDRKSARIVRERAEGWKARVGREPKTGAGAGNGGRENWGPDFWGPGQRRSGGGRGRGGGVRRPTRRRRSLLIGSVPSADDVGGCSRPAPPRQPAPPAAGLLSDGPPTPTAVSRPRAELPSYSRHRAQLVRQLSRRQLPPPPLLRATTGAAAATLPSQTRPAALAPPHGRSRN